MSEMTQYVSQNLLPYLVSKYLSPAGKEVGNLSTVISPYCCVVVCLVVQVREPSSFQIMKVPLISHPWKSYLQVFV